MKIRPSVAAAAATATVVVTAVAAISGMRLYAWSEAKRLDRLVSKNIAEISAATDMDAALLRQRSALALVLLGKLEAGRTPDISRQEADFRQAIARLERTASGSEDTRMLFELRAAFARYDSVRDRVLELVRRGDLEPAKELYVRSVSSSYEEVASLCSQVLQANRNEVRGALAESGASSKRLTLVAVGVAALIVTVGALLIWVLFRSVFLPLRTMAHEALNSAEDGALPAVVRRDDLRVLAWSLKALRSEALTMRSHRDKDRAEHEQAKRLAALGEATAKLVHDMRNRLCVLGGYAKFISERPGESDLVAESAPIIWAQVRKMELMLEEIVDFSKPISLSAEPLAMNSLIDAVAGELGPRLPAGVRLTLALSSDCPPVMANADKMERVLSNLIRNAIDAVGTSGEITVTTRGHDAHVEISVTDNGPGIPPDAKDRIFAPFFTTKKKGTGLGLAICRQVMEEHGGSITLDTNATQGTVFRLVLPFADVRGRQDPDESRGRIRERAGGQV